MELRVKRAIAKAQEKALKMLHESVKLKGLWRRACGDVSLLL